MPDQQAATPGLLGGFAIMSWVLAVAWLGLGITNREGGASGWQIFFAIAWLFPAVVWTIKWRRARREASVREQ